MPSTGTKQLNGSLPLQLTLYYNAYFSVVHAVILMYTTYYKSTKVQNLAFRQTFLMPFACIIWVVTEISRIWFGFDGNLKEKVPQVSAFVLFTFFPQIPCVLYLSFGQDILFPIEPPLGFIGLVFLVLELWMARDALYTLIDRQTAGFLRLQQETDGNKEK